MKAPLRAPVVGAVGLAVMGMGLVAACSSSGSTAHTASSTTAVSSAPPTSAATSTAVSASAVAPSSSSGSPLTSASSSGSPLTSVGTSPVTLHIFADTGTATTVQQLVPGFEKAYPNVTVKIASEGFSDFYKALPLTLASGNSADLVAIPAVTNLAKDHLLYNLNPYAQAYGWNNVYSSGQLGDYSVGSDLTTLGGNQLIALPGGYYVVGIYWNKTLGAKIGMAAPPTTLAEFQSDLAKAKAAGELPIQLGNSDASGQWILQEAAQSLAGSASVRSWIYGQPGSTFSTPGDLQAATLLQTWVKDGYTPPATTVSGQAGADAAGLFSKGQGLFIFDGNWDATTIGKALGSNVGYFSFPGAMGVAPVGSSALGVSAKTKIPNVAAAFLNYFHAPAADQVWFNAGQIPEDVSKLTPSSNSVANDVAAAYVKIHADNGAVPALSNATSSMLDTLRQNIDQLVAGGETPSGLLSALETDWKKSHG